MMASVMCAKTMTWRLGLLFAMLSSQNEENNCSDYSSYYHRKQNASGGER